MPRRPLVAAALFAAALFAAAVLLAGLGAPRALAQDAAGDGATDDGATDDSTAALSDDEDAEPPLRPTSGLTSLWSGRTLDAGHSAMAAGVGWPGLFVELALAPSARLNVGARVAVNYGSPLMGISGGIGGDVQLPVRYRVHERGGLALALALRPGFTFGQAVLVGEEGPRANDFGWGARLDAGVLLGGRASEEATLTIGALVGGGLSDVAGERVEAFGEAYATAAAEVLVSGDTMVFALVEGGYGLARADRFGTGALFRLWLGLAYEL